MGGGLKLNQEQIGVIEDTSITWLRHGIQHAARAANLTYDKLGRVHLFELAEKFQERMGEQLNLQLGQDTTYAALLVHVMSWFPRRFVFWVDERDFDSDLGLATRYPLMVSAVSGHTIVVDMN